MRSLKFGEDTYLKSKSCIHTHTRTYARMHAHSEAPMERMSWHERLDLWYTERQKNAFWGERNIPYPVLHLGGVSMSVYICQNSSNYALK